VRIEVDNSKHLLRPGQAVDAKIRASGATQQTATVVPAEAVTYVDGRPTVFVTVGPLSVLPTSVELGRSDGKQRQILAGLTPGQHVITHGVFELKSELFR
jgi:cobalt-zinc-cadmium efflux system membrane fusion protein